MLQNQCISVTDLRTKTKECLSDLDKEPKYIFINNKPIAVLLTISNYQSLIQHDLIELKESDVDENLKKQATLAKKLRKSDLINL